MKSKFKNYGLWLSIASLIGLVLQNSGVDIAPVQYQDYVDTILSVLVLAGIISNPSKGIGFKDGGVK